MTKKQSTRLLISWGLAAILSILLITGCRTVKTSKEKISEAHQVNNASKEDSSGKKTEVTTTVNTETEDGTRVITATFDPSDGQVLQSGHTGTAFDFIAGGDIQKSNGVAIVFNNDGSIQFNKTPKTLQVSDQKTVFKKDSTKIEKGDTASKGKSEILVVNDSKKQDNKSTNKRGVSSSLVIGIIILVAAIFLFTWIRKKTKTIID